MYKYRCIIQTTSWHNVLGLFSSASKLLSVFFCSDSAVFMIPTLLADIFNHPIESRHRVPNPWKKVHIARFPSIILP